MEKTSIDYSEILLQAVDIVVGQRLSEMKFDETIKCKIVEVIDKEKGEYAVLYNDTLRFTAYAEEGKNYREGNLVYVLVPKGDYTQDKIIQGRYSSSEKEEPVTFTSPLKNIEKIQDIYVYNIEPIYLAANSDKDIDLSSRGLIYKKDELNKEEIKYLCISAEFKTLLNNYDIREGDYGLAFIINTNKKTYNYILSANSDMFGNPYGYQIFQKQEQAYSITFEQEEEPLGFGLIFYQDNNFKYYDGINFDFQKIEPSALGIKDIGVQNINIFFGKDIPKIEPVVLTKSVNVLSQNSTDIDPNETYVIDGKMAQLLLDFINSNKE